MRALIVALIMSLLFVRMVKAESVAGYDVDRLATAIFHAEGGTKTAWPYGILKRYKTTTPRQACINTIRSKHREWIKQGSHGDYLEYLQSRYAPLNASNDPTGLNHNWLGNVNRLYKKLSTVDNL